MGSTSGEHQWGAPVCRCGARLSSIASDATANTDLDDISPREDQLLCHLPGDHITSDDRVLGAGIADLPDHISKGNDRRIGMATGGQTLHHVAGSGMDLWVVNRGNRGIDYTDPTSCRAIALITRLCFFTAARPIFHTERTKRICGLHWLHSMHGHVAKHDRTEL